MPIDYNDKIFRSVGNTAGGDVGADTVFHYRQQGRLVWATYHGGAVRYGTLIARVLEDDVLDMRYQHVTTAGALRTGRCRTIPLRLPGGRLRLQEQWAWTEGADGTGYSEVEEIDRREMSLESSAD